MVTLNRVETDVLLAIRPEHLKTIISRTKNHEFRSYKLPHGVERLWLYETLGTPRNRGCQAKTYIATIPPNIRHLPGAVLEESSGIGNAEFNAGKKQSKFAYPTLELYKLDQPIKLEEMKSKWGIAAPMGWSYVKRSMWEDRWADENCLRKPWTSVFRTLPAPVREG